MSEDFPIDNPDQCQASWDRVLEQVAHPLFGFLYGRGYALTWARQGGKTSAANLFGPPTPPPVPSDTCTRCDGDGSWHWDEGDIVPGRPVPRLTSDDPCPECDGTGKAPLAGTIVEVDLYPSWETLADGWAELIDRDGDRLDIDWEGSISWAITRVFIGPDDDLWFGYDRGESTDSPFDRTTVDELTRLDRMQTWYDHLDEQHKAHRIGAVDYVRDQAARATEAITKYRRNRR